MPRGEPHKPGWKMWVMIRTKDRLKPAKALVITRIFERLKSAFQKRGRIPPRRGHGPCRDANGVIHTSPGQRPGFVANQPSGALKARLMFGLSIAAMAPV